MPFLIIVVSICFSFSVKALELTPQEVVNLTLNNSLDLKEINKKALLATNDYWIKVGKYDAVFTTDLSYEISQTESLTSIFTNEEDRYAIYNLGVTKDNQYGGTFEFGFARTSRSSILNSFSSSNSLPEETTLDIISFSWTQNLLRNAFGKADRTDIEIALKNIENSDLQKIEDIENLVLSNLKLFWDAYVAQEKYKQSMDALKRTQRLLKTVKKKSRIGYTQPGELSQVNAEAQEKMQAMQTASLDYLKHIDELKYRLQLLVAASDIKFKAETEIPSLPTLSTKPASELRPYKIQVNQLHTAKKELTKLTYNSIPKLDLVAKSEFTGAETKQEDALAEAMGGSRPVYYLGLSFEHTINSQSYKGVKENAEANIYVNELRLQKLKLELDNSLLHSTRQVHASFQNARSSVASEKYRQKNIKEIEKAYKQGRTDINSLIIAYNNYDNSKTLAIQSLGQYHVVLNNYAALVDSLINIKKDDKN